MRERRCESGCEGNERERERWHVYYYMGIHLLDICGCERHVRTKCGVIN